jgi:hypothetical protein
MSQKGFRVPSQPSKKEAVKQVQTELANLQMAGRVSQMMTQQLMQNVKKMSDDLGMALNQLYELQYKYGALQKHLKLDTDELNKIANEQRLVDFNEAAAKQDASEKLIEVEAIGADSTIVLTSTATDDKGNDCGIFRSRVKLTDSGVPELIQGLQGKKVGDKVTVKLNDLDHTIEVLAIRDPEVKEEANTSEDTPDQVAPSEVH